MNDVSQIWPTHQTWLWLFLGLVPLLLVTYSSWQHGFRAALSLRTVAVVFIWIGYHLNAWIALLTKQDWTNFLLVESCVDDGLLFSALVMICYIVGYDFVLRSGPGTPLTGHAEVDTSSIPGISPLILGGAIMLCLSLLVISVGDLGELWASTRARGEGQFDERFGYQKVIQMMLVLTTPVTVFTACLAALIFINQKISAGTRWALGLAGLVSASLISMYFFSRGSGFAFMLLAFLTLRLRGKRGMPLAVFATFLGLYLCWIGLQARNDRFPGVGNFLEAMVQLPFQRSGEEVSLESASLMEQNPLSAIEPWTRKAEDREIHRGAEDGLMLKFFWVLHPFPSELVPVTYLGRGLSEVMSTVGTLGITTPMLADFYYVFGFAGALLMLPLGACFSWFERRFVRTPSIVTLFCLLLCFISIPISLHSWVRSATRPILYAFFLLAGAYLYRLITHPPRQRARRIMPGATVPPGRRNLSANQLPS